MKPKIRPLSFRKDTLAGTWDVVSRAAVHK